MPYPTKKLGEVAILNPKKSEMKEFSDDIEVTFVPMSAVNEFSQSIASPEVRRLGEVRKGYTYFRNSDVLFAKITPCMENGKVAIARDLKNGVGFGSTEFHVIRPTSEITSEWIFHIVANIAFRKEAETRMQGAAGQRRVPISFLVEYKIPLPPIAEQRRIVARIEKQFAKIDEAARLRAESEVATAQLLPAALHEIFSSAESKGWGIEKIEDICEHPQYGFTASASRKAVGPRLLRITDIQNGKVNWETVPYCICPTVEKYELRAGDLVFARTGATVGKSFLIVDVPKDVIFASYLIRLRAREKIMPEFLYFFFQSPDYWYQITMGQVGMAQPNVNGTKLVQIKIPLPLLAEQEKIVKKLDALSGKVRALQELQSSQSADLKALKQSILHEAFSGEVE